MPKNWRLGRQNVIQPYYVIYNVSNNIKYILTGKDNMLLKKGRTQAYVV